MSDSIKKTILLVEDDELIAMVNLESVKSFGYKVIHARSGESALELFQFNNEIDLILMDIDLGLGMDGPEAAKEILRISEVPIVFLTSHSEKEYVERVRKITRYGYVTKSSGSFVLKSSIEMGFELFEAYNRIKIREKDLEVTQKLAKIGMWTWNIITNQLEWSDEMYTIFAVDKKTFNGSLDEIIINRIHPDDRTRVIEYNSKVKFDGISIPLEFRLLLPDNSVKYVWAEASQLFMDEKNQSSVLKGYVQDVTHRKSLEIELENFYSSVPVLLCVASSDGYFIKLNKEWERVLGYSTDELLKIPFLNLIHPDDIEDTKREISLQLAGGKTLLFKNRYKTKNNNYVTLEWCASPASNGKTLYASAKVV